MALVIAVAQQKGGSGKTTLAANLAAVLAERYRVAVLDIDPQRSLSRWHELRAARAGLAAVHGSDVSGWRLANELDRLGREYDAVLVDSSMLAGTLWPSLVSVTVTSRRVFSCSTSSAMVSPGAPLSSIAPAVTARG